MKKKNHERNQNVTLEKYHLMQKKAVQKEEETKKTWVIQKTKSKTADLNPTIAIISYIKRALIIALSIIWMDQTIQAKGRDCRGE